MILAIDPGPTQTAISYVEKGMRGKRKHDGLTANQRYYLRHREARLAESKAYRESDKEKHAARMRDYRKRRPDVIKLVESKRIRPYGHQEKFNAYCRLWKLNNPDKRLASYQKRRVQKNGSISGSEIAGIRKAQKGECYYCQNPLDNKSRGHLEHKVPFCRGGKHEASNICFACSSCNLKKGKKTADEFIGH